MPRLFMLLVLTFFESLATILIERGSYFYCKHYLNFTDAENLLLALVFGIAYAFGALSSHPICARLGEKRVLAAAVAAQLLVHVGMGLSPICLGLSPTISLVMFVGGTLTGMLNGQKWPVVESYVTAGQTPLQTARTLGYFNFSWAVAVPAALVVAGPLIQWNTWSLFALGGVLNIITLSMVAFLPGRPVHTPLGHPGRPQPQQARRLTSLMNAGRMLMLASYSSMWVLAALMPGIFDKLGCSIGQSTAYSAALDITRLTAFVILGAWTGWHGRSYPLVLAMPILAGGFSMVIFGASLPVVLGGELMFGAGAGIIYFASLYYAIVVKNASVEAGGGHEGLIGSGFALGPLAGLIGIALEPHIGSQVAGIMLGVAPIFCICYLLASRSLIRLGRPVVEPR